MQEIKETYKQYIGKISSRYYVAKIKQITSIPVTTGAGEEAMEYDPNEIRYIRISDFDKRGVIIEDKKVSVPLAKGKKHIVQTGDILAATAGGTVGKTMMFEKTDETCCYAGYLARIRPNEKIMYSRYLFYQLQSPIMDFFRECAVKKTTIENISATLYSNMSVIVPPLQEQKKIADYLDQKCSEIDSVIADLQEQIDKLEQYKRSVISETVTKGLNQKAPMKDSGISWVGMIPANWGVKRGKYIFSYIQKPTREDDGIITCFRDGEVTLRSNRREDGFTMSDKEIGYQGIDVGDLIIHGMDGFAGAIGISDSRGKASPVLNVLETNQSKRYFMYLLRTMAYKGVFEALSTGIRVRTCDTNWGKIKNIFYIVPPVEEQMCIVNYIDEKCAEIESIIADKKQQLEVVENYKKSLIYEYVTGKKEVVDE